MRVQHYSALVRTDLNRRL